MKIKPPLISKAHLQPTRLADLLPSAEEGDRFSGFHFENETLSEAVLGCLEFAGCQFTACRFPDCTFERTQFTDVRFDRCDFSGARLREGIFHRTVLEGCKLVGCHMGGCYLRDAVWDTCLCRYLNLYDSELKAVHLSGCSLQSASLTACKLQLMLSDCDLTNCTVMDTPLSGTDLSSCQTGGMKLTAGALQGASICREQAADFIHLLGAHIVPGS